MIYVKCAPSFHAHGVKFTISRPCAKLHNDYTHAFVLCHIFSSDSLRRIFRYTSFKAEHSDPPPPSFSFCWHSWPMLARSSPIVFVFAPLWSFPKYVCSSSSAPPCHSSTSACSALAN